MRRYMLFALFFVHKIYGDDDLCVMYSDVGKDLKLSCPGGDRFFFRNIRTVIDPASYSYEGGLHVVLRDVQENQTGLYACKDSQNTTLWHCDILIKDIPDNITGINAISDNFENMDVSWDPVDGDIPVKYSVNWQSSHGKYLVRTGDGCDESSGTHCFFCYTSFPPSNETDAARLCTQNRKTGVNSFRRFADFTVNITAETQYGNISGSLTFNSDENMVKPRRVRNLKLTLGSKLTWDKPLNMGLSLYYDIWVDGSHRAYTTQQYYQLETRPNVVSVRSKPVSRNGNPTGHWSEYRTLNVN